MRLISFPETYFYNNTTCLCLSEFSLSHKMCILEIKMEEHFGLLLDKSKNFYVNWNYFVEIRCLRAAQILNLQVAFYMHSGSSA